MRCLVAAFGDPGHVFPAVSLARALRGRGHEVIVETWPQWQQVVEEAGLRFVSADQYQVFPPPASGSPGAGQAAAALMPLLEDFRPEGATLQIVHPRHRRKPRRLKVFEDFLSDLNQKVRTSWNITDTQSPGPGRITPLSE